MSREHRSRPLVALAALFLFACDSGGQKPGTVVGDTTSGAIGSAKPAAATSVAATPSASPSLEATASAAVAPSAVASAEPSGSAAAGSAAVAGEIRVPASSSGVLAPGAADKVLATGKKPIIAIQQRVH